MTATRQGTDRPQRVRAVIAANKLTLSRTERHELTAMLTDHHGSWTTLTEEDAARIADALQAFLVVQGLMLLRRRQR